MYPLPHRPLLDTVSWTGPLEKRTSRPSLEFFNTNAAPPDTLSIAALKSSEAKAGREATVAAIARIVITFIKSPVLVFFNLECFRKNGGDGPLRIFQNTRR